MYKQQCCLYNTLELAGEKWAEYGRYAAVKLSEGKKSEITKRTLLLDAHRLKMNRSKKIGNFA